MSAFVAVAALAMAGHARADEWVNTCGSYPNHVFVSPPSELNADQFCPNGWLRLTNGSGDVPKGTGAIWQAVAPPGLTITQAWISGLTSHGVNSAKGAYGGYFYWGGGKSNIQPGQTWAIFTGLNSRYFGWFLGCGNSTCHSSTDGALIWVTAVNLEVTEATPPSLSASGLWQASGWVRGVWPLHVSGDSPSGVCSLSASLGGQSVAQSRAGQQDTTTWHQCAAGPIDVPVNTAGFANGADTLQIGAVDAAGASPSLSRTVEVDNQQPTVSLAGPSDVPSTAGTQYVTATAAAGPSGVDGISCSLDGAPAAWYPGASAQIAVSGIGTHELQCRALNDALDTSGAHGTSATETFSMRIGEPTIAAVAFSKVVNRLRCHKAIGHVHVRGRWVRVRRHGKLVRVYRKGHWVRRRVVRCHPRTVRRRMTRVVTIKRHGKKIRVKRTKVVRVVLLPRTVYKTHRRVRHGHATTVSGWLGASDGTALGGQTVQVLTAADNGRNNYHVAAVATTAANGGWSARLPAGPSRLVTAAYAGSATTEGALAAPVHLIVPAKVRLLSAWPRRVAWGGLVRLRGRLKGGYLPPGGALVRLRIGQGRAAITYGVKTHVTGNGRFTTVYRFGAGAASVHRAYWFQVASLPMGAYPYAPAVSRRLTVYVGGHPKPPRTHHKRHKKARHQ